MAVAFRYLPRPSPAVSATFALVYCPYNLVGRERLHDSDGGEQDKWCGLLACLGGKPLGSLVGNEMQRFADAARFLHALRLVRNACFAMLFQKIHQLIESFLSDFGRAWYMMLTYLLASSGFVSLPWLFQQLTTPRIRPRAWAPPQKLG